jgi:hypothetical protein
MSQRERLALSDEIRAVGNTLSLFNPIARPHVGRHTNGSSGLLSGRSSSRRTHSTS